MKFKKYIKILSYFIIFIMIMGTAICANAEDVFKVITDKTSLYTVQYDGYDITARRISIEGSDNVVYCLEINKKYPTGQSFSLNGDVSENINNILAAGYPNRSVAELNLDNENEAYFATQIAIWSSLEGYDVNKFRGDNPKILNAIRNIYNDAMSVKYTNKIRSKIYKTNDESIQEIITMHYDDLISEEKAESIQKEYPPQEG
jgi:TQXA domain-containing protein